ncbi:MAG: hypothetical protein ACFHXK_14210 [bacterium]
MTDRERTLAASQDTRLAQSWRQIELREERHATRFDEIWRRAEAQCAAGRSGSVGHRAAVPGLFRHQRFGWSLAAAGAVVLCLYVVTQINPQKVHMVYDEPLFTAKVTSDDSLFSALLVSTHWSAPSDRFLKQTPPMKIWGTPTLEIRPPDST